MKTHRRRILSWTKVYRMFCTSTFGLIMFTLLDSCCKANNVTEVTSLNMTDNQNQHRFLTRNTWLRGFELCRDIHNLTMASVDDIKDMSNITLLEKRGNGTAREKDWLEKNLPIWTYAFQVTDKNTGNTLLVKRSDVTRYERAYKCSNSNGEELLDCCETIANAKYRCESMDGYKLHLPVMEISKFASFAQMFWINTPRWIKLDNEEEFLSGTANLTVRCLLLDENGELRTDDCEKNHRSLCIGDNSQPVVRYQGKVKVPRYQSSTTNRGSSGRSSTFTKSSSSSSKQDTNNTHTFSTVSISPYPVQDNSGIWMDPQVRYSIISVGTFIVLAVLVAVCCCCCRRRRNGNERRKSTRLADMYSETADSLAMKEGSVYETADTSEYAVPDDAVKKARHRESIGENEYDVISQNNKTPTKFTGNAYNHVSIVSTLDKRRSSNQEENTYDVTNYGKQNTIVLSPNDLTGNVYGDIEIKTER